MVSRTWKMYRGVNMKLPNNFIHFLRVNAIVWGFLILALTLAYLNNDNAKFW